MTEMDIPGWFYKAISLVVFWLVGQIVVEWLKQKIKKNETEIPWTGEDRRRNIVVDEKFLNEFMDTYKKHVRLVEDMTNVITDIAERFEAHDEKEARNHKFIKDIHEKMVLE